MKRILFLLSIFVIYGCGSSKSDRNNKRFVPVKIKSMDISMFPKAKADQIQHVIELPTLKDEKDNKVEIFIAKEMKVDCNHHHLQGALLEKELKGWGYNYYIFNTNGEVMSTMMGCPDNKLTLKDINSDSKLLNYNSKLPIVIYTPKGYKAKYKIWSVASEEILATPSKN